MTRLFAVLVLLLAAAASRTAQLSCMQVWVPGRPVTFSPRSCRCKRTGVGSWTCPITFAPDALCCVGSRQEKMLMHF